MWAAVVAGVNFRLVLMRMAANAPSMDLFEEWPCSYARFELYKRRHNDSHKVTKHKPARFNPLLSMAIRTASIPNRQRHVGLENVVT